jgi:Protein of unknown function (DUF3363)
MSSRRFLVSPPANLVRCYVEARGAFDDVFLRLESGASSTYCLTLTSGRFAMIDNGLGFALVPWTPELDRHLGRHVVGVAKESAGIEWSFGRKCGRHRMPLPAASFSGGRQAAGLRMAMRARLSHGQFADQPLLPKCPRMHEARAAMRR